MQITPDRQLLAAAGRTFCCLLKKGRVTLPVLPSKAKINKFPFKFLMNQKIGGTQDQNGRIVKRIMSFLSAFFRLHCFMSVIVIIIIINAFSNC